MNLKRAMNDDTTESVDQVNGSKLRKQSDEQIGEKSESVNAQSHSKSTQNTLNGFPKNADSQCTTSFNNLNGVEMNNLNSHNVSNGYSAKHKENLSRNQQHVNRSTKDSSFRRIYTSSSSSDDDEQCVYTYKGAEVASDLPESFFYLGMNVSNGRQRTSVCSSPDMDYLEMDFDPGPSNGQDSDSDNTSLTQNMSDDLIFESSHELMNKFKAHEVYDFDSDVGVTCDENANCYSKKTPLTAESNKAENFNLSTDLLSLHDAADREKPCCSKTLSSSEFYAIGQVKDSEQSNNYDEALYDASTSDEEVCCYSDSKSHSNISFRKLSEDSDKEEITFIPDAFHNERYENLDGDFDTTEFNISLLEPNFDDILINYEELLPADPTYSVSAIMNVLKLLRISWVPSDREKLVSLLQRKQIPENVSFVEYLYMRAVQNANENDLKHFSSNVFEGKLYSRFFSTYPKTNVNLLEWLSFWMRRGAVPVVTRNIQERGALHTDNIIPNPWRHNVVYRIESSFFYLSNPNEKITKCHLYSQLSQAPLIYIKRKSILKRWNANVDLRTLMRANNNRWYNENVLGQVVTVIREHYCGSKTTQYVRIPSNCNCGITLFVPSENSTLCNEINEALELPRECF